MAGAIRARHLVRAWDTRRMTEDGERRTRRRGAELEAHILDSAWLELSERGWQRFTVEGTAARAATGKASVYARWATKAELILAATHRQVLAREILAPQTGDIATDLLELLRATATAYAGPFGEAARGMVAYRSAEGRDAGWSEGLSLSVVSTILANARAVGQLGSGQIPDVAANAGLAVLVRRLLVGGAVTDATLHEIVDGLWLPLIRFHAGRARRPNQ